MNLFKKKIKIPSKGNISPLTSEDRSFLWFGTETVNFPYSGTDPRKLECREESELICDLLFLLQGHFSRIFVGFICFAGL